MKRVSVYFTLIAALMGSISYADANPPEQNHELVEKNNPNHFYFGPEFICYQLNIHIQDVKIYGTRYFSGFRIGYEYLKPKAFYVGVDLLGSSTETDFKASSKEHHLSWHRADRGFGELELRLGYTFAPTNWMVTPFLGLGTYDVFAIDHHNHQGFQEVLPYATGGARAIYAFNPVFNIGLNLKILRTIGAMQRFKSDSGEAKTHHNMWGGEIAVPFIWHVGSPKKRWDIQLVPYFLKLDFSELQNIYGTRVLFGYHF